MAALKSRVVLTALLVLVVAVPYVGAQGSAMTGTIEGTVTDNTRAVVPGVTITASSPALMGTRSVVTEADGGYRFPALSPGVYTLVFELPGFATVRRENIQLSLGFTATINAEMAPAGIQENVTVSGASPVVDVTSTTVTTNMGAEQLSNLMGARDQQTIMGLIAGVNSSQMDVGGSTATSYQTFTAYGLRGQSRGEVEGMVTTESATVGEIFYSDWNSFEDVAVNAVGNTAEMPQPGTLVSVVAKSGSNKYSGKVYLDYQNEGWQAHNIDADQIRRGLRGAGNVATEDLNRLTVFRDFNVDIGGFVVKDKLWWYAAYRNSQKNRAFPNLLDDIEYSEIPVYTGKATYNLTPNNKLIWYHGHSIKLQKNYVAYTTNIGNADAFQKERWPSGTYKGEFNSVLGSAAVLEVRSGFFYERGFFNGKGANPRYQDIGNLRVYGTDIERSSYHDRPQLNGALTLFKDGWAGTHSFKFGGEFMHEVNHSLNQVYNNLIMRLNNGLPSQVEIYEPAVDSRNTMWATSGYIQDTWKLNSRVSLNLGVRLDRYFSYVPEQAGASGRRFERIDGPTWNNVGPRLGVVYGLTEDGRNVLKLNYGQYWEFPFTSISTAMNPNPTNTFSRYNWTPANPQYVNGLPVYQPGQEGLLISFSGARPDGRSSTRLDPDLVNSYNHQATAYFEREVASSFGVRTGFVWNAKRQGRATYNANQPFEAFNVPVTVTDPGPDGILGNADDAGTVQAFNLDPARLSLPLDQVLRTTDSLDADYYSWEVQANKRFSGRWSVLGSFANTWNRTGIADITPNALVRTDNGKDVYNTWQAKLTGTVDVGWGLRVTPAIRHQAGEAFARTFLARLNYNSAVTINAEPVGTRRADHVTLADVRAERRFRLGWARFAALFDLYNITNSNADQQVTTQSGSTYLRPRTITGPRIARVGVKFDW